MNIARSISAALIVGTVVSFAAVPSFAQHPAGKVIASGLQGPRGLRFGPDGNLYVAEAGTGGTTSTAGLCKQVPGPPSGPGPYTGGKTGRISKISPNGTVTTVASGFPSAVSAGGYIGVADVAFLGNALYALVGGGGCSHGNRGSPAGIALVDLSTGNWNLIANVSTFLRANPTAYESADDFEPDGTLYSMIAADGNLYAVEPNHGEVLAVTKSGTIRQLIDISASEGHIVPTAIAEYFGSLYVGNLNLFPIDPQWARVLTISNPGYDGYLAPGFGNDSQGYHIVNSKAGFTTVVAVDFGPDGLLYVLELSDAPGLPTGGAGKVVRVTRSGEIENVVTGLVVPTGMTFGTDGRLFISNFGAAPPGAGQILRVDVVGGV